jgi:hypothetical protein
MSILVSLVFHDNRFNSESKRRCPTKKKETKVREKSKKEMGTL